MASVDGALRGYPDAMRIGSSIGLIALGLILALAVNVDLGGIDINLVGWILTIVGIIGIAASILLARQSRAIVAPPRDPYGRDIHPAERDRY